MCIRDSWYSGDKNHDRWMYNFNIFDLDELSNSTEYDTTTGYPEGFLGWTPNSPS